MLHLLRLPFHTSYYISYYEPPFDLVYAPVRNIKGIAMASSKAYRAKLCRVVQLGFQLFIVLLLVVLIVIWALLLANISQNQVFNSFSEARLIQACFAIPRHIADVSLNGTELTADKVFAITNLAIPELFALIALLAVALNDIYWCATTGLVLFVFWILDHQRYPSLFGRQPENSFQVLLLTAHALHLACWVLLLMCGGLVALQWRLSNRISSQPESALTMPAPCHFGNYCGYLSPGLLPVRMPDAPPYYDMTPPTSTFESNQLRSSRAMSDAN